MHYALFCIFVLSNTSYKLHNKKSYITKIDNQNQRRNIRQVDNTSMIHSTNYLYRVNTKYLHPIELLSSKKYFRKKKIQFSPTFNIHFYENLHETSKFIPFSEKLCCWSIKEIDYTTSEKKL